MNRSLRHTLALCVLAPALASGAGHRLTTVLEVVGSEVKAERAMEHMREVYSRDRWFTFTKFEQTARCLARAMKSAGLGQVEIVHPPADGISQFGYWTMPLAWDVRLARMRLHQRQRAPVLFLGNAPPGRVVARTVGPGREGARAGGGRQPLL